MRPRLGDYVAIAVGSDTLVTPKELAKFGGGDAGSCAGRCQGAHGSLARDEMRIPFVVATTARPTTTTE